jgi:rhodanese-related sulfurtransferase
MTESEERISLPRLFKMFGMAGLIAILLLVTSGDLSLSSFASESSDSEIRVPTYQSIDLADTLRAFNYPANVILDARPSFVYDMGHVKNAISVPVDVIASMSPELIARIKGAPEVVVYCDGPWCGLAGHEVGLLLGKGITNTVVYSGGWEEWRSCQLPRTPAGS